MADNTQNTGGKNLQDASPDGEVVNNLDHPYLKNKVVIMNGFSNEEITRIMRAVRGTFDPPADLVFAKTTPNSLEMVLKDLIIDMSGDHEYLKKNPPQVPKK